MEETRVRRVMPYIWAPEIHYIDGKWYIYYAAGGLGVIYGGFALMCLNVLMRILLQEPG